MRYFTEKPKDTNFVKRFAYKCDHPLYSECTLFRDNSQGLAVIQKRFNARLKIFWYGPIEVWLIQEILNQPNFAQYLKDNGKEPTDGLYPTVTIRQLMWALKMKPLRKEWWESQEKQCI